MTMYTLALCALTFCTFCVQAAPNVGRALSFLGGVNTAGYDLLVILYRLKSI